MSSPLIILLALLPLLLTALVVFVLFRVVQAKYQAAARARLPKPDAHGDILVPVMALFSGIKGVPLVATASNSAQPRLVLQPGGIEYQVLFRKRAAWSEIQQVDVWTGPGTVNLVFDFHNEAGNLAANLGARPLAIEVLRWLDGKCPLSPRARVFMAQTQKTAPTRAGAVLHH